MCSEEKIVQISVSTICNKLLKSSSYIITKGDTVVLVDCGDVDKMIDELKGKIPNAIILTHCHQDHVYGLPALLEYFPQLRIFCSQLTLEGLKDEERNLSYIIPEYPFSFTQDENIILIDEGDVYINELCIKAIPTPGHSDDCTTYIIDDCMFSGDSYIPFAKVFTKWPRSNRELAYMNENRIIEIVYKQQLKVYSGHWL